MRDLGKKFVLKSSQKFVVLEAIVWRRLFRNVRRLKKLRQISNIATGDLANPSPY